MAGAAGDWIEVEGDLIASILQLESASAPPTGRIEACGVDIE
jgi:hypothetical protein